MLSIQNARSCAKDAITLLDAAEKIEDAHALKELLAKATAFLHVAEAEARMAHDDQKKFLINSGQ